MNELNRQIAEALGWQVVATTDWDSFRKEAVDGFVIVDQEGAWQSDFFLQKETLWANFSRWNSVDKALELVPEGLFFHLLREDDGRAWDASFSDVWGITRGRGRADTPAEAICRAWLAWHKAQEARDAES